MIRIISNNSPQNEAPKIEIIPDEAAIVVSSTC